MANISAFGNIKDGKLSLANRKRFEQEIAGCKDGPVELIIKKKNRRSLLQNNFYWAVVVQEVRLGLLEIGYRMTNEETHYFLKQKFNPVEIPNAEGEAIQVPGSTTTLNKSEFSEYVERIAQWASEYLGVVIPPANSDLQLQF